MDWDRIPPRLPEIPGRPTVAAAVPHPSDHMLTDRFLVCSHKYLVCSWLNLQGHYSQLPDRHEELLKYLLMLQL